MRRIALLALFAALGLAAALGITAKPAAAWDIGALPAPYTVDALYNAGAHVGECQSFYVVHWYDQSVTLGYGPEVGQQFSDCNPQFQQQLDAFVDATVNETPPVTTAPPVTTDTTPTTTAGTTTTAPVDTTATTTTAPAPLPQTVTVTTVITDPTINDRLTALETQYAALASRVDAIAKANTASWDAFLGVVQTGGSVVDAALAARSAGLNAMYELG